jgi:hypothetical protein
MIMKEGGVPEERAHTVGIILKQNNLYRPILLGMHNVLSLDALQR